MEAKEKKHILTGGMILIALGILILLSNMGIYGFDKSWPILLIVISIGILIQRVKDIGGWFIGVAGLILSVNNWGYDLHAVAIYLIPLILILVGVNGLIKQYKKKQQQS